jgi:hypothetical protein
MCTVNTTAAGCYVSGLAELEVASAAELKEYIRQGLRVRHALQNRGRPRGKPHTLIDIRIESRDSDALSSTMRHATLRFVETAGRCVI